MFKVIGDGEKGCSEVEVVERMTLPTIRVAPALLSLYKQRTHCEALFESSFMQYQRSLQI